MNHLCRKSPSISLRTFENKMFRHVSTRTMVIISPCFQIDVYYSILPSFKHHLLKPILAPLGGGLQVETVRGSVIPPHLLSSPRTLHIVRPRSCPRCAPASADTRHFGFFRNRIPKCFWGKNNNKNITFKICFPDFFEVRDTQIFWRRSALNTDCFHYFLTIMDYFPTDLEATPKKFSGTGLQQLWMHSVRELAGLFHMDLYIYIHNHI